MALEAALDVPLAAGINAASPKTRRCYRARAERNVPVRCPQILADLANRARAKTVPAELFADRFDFPSRYALGNSELEFSYLGDQASGCNSRCHFGKKRGHGKQLD